jgi:hypothetical protein
VRRQFKFDGVVVKTRAPERGGFAIKLHENHRMSGTILGVVGQLAAGCVDFYRPFF